jgi:hypothetical protein
MRVVSALLAVLFCGFLAGAGFLFLGEATGWLNVHSDTTAPMWWRLTYAGITVLGTIAIAVMCGRAAWRSKE